MRGCMYPPRLRVFAVVAYPAEPPSEPSDICNIGGVHAC